MRAKHFPSIAALFCLAAAPCAPVRAQGAHPQLAGHTFVPSSLVPDPFVASHFATMIGLGEGFDYQIGWPVIDGEPLFTTEGQMTWLMLDLDYRQRVATWLTLGGTFVGGARVGTNAASAIADGVSVVTGMQFEGMARVVQRGPIALSGHLSITRSHLSLLNILGFAEELADSVRIGGSLDSLSIAYGFDAWRWHGGARFAYAPSRLVGLSAELDAALGDELFAIQRSDVDLSMAASVDLNFHSAGHAPVGVVAGYRYEGYTDRDAGGTGGRHTLMVGISYVGREAFSLGLEAIGGQTRLADGEDVKLTTLMIRMRYYF